MSQVLDRSSFSSPTAPRPRRRRRWWWWTGGAAVAMFAALAILHSAGPGGNVACGCLPPPPRPTNPDMPILAQVTNRFSIILPADASDAAVGGRWSLATPLDPRLVTALESHIVTDGQREMEQWTFQPHAGGQYAILFRRNDPTGGGDLSGETRAYRVVVDSDPKVVTAGRAGEPFSIVLVTNPSMSKRYALAAPLESGLVELVGHEAVRDASGAPLLVNGLGREEWTFRALAPGTTTIALTYTAAATPSAADPYVFTIVVR